MTKLQDVIDKFGIYTYKSPLIRFKSEIFTQWKHRELIAEKDFIGNAYICKLDEEIFTELPIFEPDYLTPDTEEEPNPEFDSKMLEEWIKEGWQDLMIAMTNAARTHSFCIIQLYDDAPYWRVFTFREITKIVYDKNKNDIPVSAVVKWVVTLPLAETAVTHREELSFKDNDKKAALLVSFGSRKGKELGKYDLEPIWDLMIYIRYMMLDIVNNSAKSSGFYWFTYGSAIKPDQKQDLLDAADITGAGSGIGAKKVILEDIKAMYPAHPEFTVMALSEAVSMVAGVTRLPTSFYRGEKQGGGVFNEGFSDEAKTNKKKKYIFAQFKKDIIKLVEMRWGKKVTDVQPYIKEELEQDSENVDKAEDQFDKDHFKDSNDKQKKEEPKKLLKDTK